MADLLRVALYGVLPSLAATLLLVGLFGPRLLGVSAGLGLLVAWGLLKQRLPLWPHELWTTGNDAMQWLCWTVLGLGVVSALHGRRQWPRGIIVPLGCGLFGAQAWLVLTNLRRRWDLLESIVQHGAAAALATAVWFGIRHAITQRSSSAMALLLALALAGDAALLMASGSAFQGQLAGSVATSFAAAAATVLWRRSFPLDRSAAMPFAAAHCGLLMLGVHLSELHPLPAVAAALAPLCLAAAGPAVGAFRDRLRLGACAAAMGGLIGLALALQLGWLG
jgi:hypothetical protein